MNLFSKEDVNTKRQLEFDFAKAICILGMVFVHCFEEFPLVEEGYEGSLYYIFVTVLNSLFGAGTFMVCLGIGLTYTKNNNPNDFIKRGLNIFLLGYLLNIFRFVLPECFYFIVLDPITVFKELLFGLLYVDIMQFAGLSFILFGLLKKFKISDIGIAIIAIIMSVIGSFVNKLDLGNAYPCELLGLFAGTCHNTDFYFYFAPFPLLNWFIIVIFGYFFGKLIRKVNNIEKFYCLSTIISGVIIITYMLISIPNKYGMMSGEEINYFQMTTWEAFIIMMGAVFAFGLYHYISKLLGDKVKEFITILSININKSYMIHWILVGFSAVLLVVFIPDGLKTYMVLIIAIIIYILSTLFAELIRKKIERRSKDAENEK